MKKLRCRYTVLFLLSIACFIAIPLAGQTVKTARELREKSKPGAQHAKLDPFIGKWKIRIQYRVRPDTNPEMATGKAEFRWILDKRFLEQTVEGKGIAGAWEGRGLIGYDNILNRYSGTWVDAMNSGITTSTGSVDSDGRTFRFKNTGTDPLAGKVKTSDAVLRVLGKDELQYVLFAPHPETGKQVAMLNIGYKRDD